jgi:hypothetical protein
MGIKVLVYFHFVKYFEVKEEVFQELAKLNMPHLQAFQAPHYLRLQYKDCLY